MEYEIAEMRLAELERRIRELESAQDDNQGMNAQLPPFVPIPQIGESLPWTYSGTDGWTNGIAQFGYNRLFITPDLAGIHSYGSTVITGTDKTDDGSHYLEVNTLEGTAEIKVANVVPPHDPIHGIVCIGLGVVHNGKLTSGLHHNPVIYTYV